MAESRPLEWCIDGHSDGLPPRATTLNSYKPVIDEILRKDLDAHRKQRHTVTRIFHTGWSRNKGPTLPAKASWPQPTLFDDQPSWRTASRPSFAVSLEKVARIEHGGDGLDFGELVLVAEHGDAHQRAGNVMVSERVPDYLPGGHQVLPPGRCDKNPCADDVLE